MAERYLIDTSAIIKFLNGSLPVDGLSFIDKIVDEESVISFVAEIELQVWDAPAQSDLEIYQIFLKNSTVIGVDSQIVKETIRIRKAFKVKLPDALIAATALIEDRVLIADNDKDFKKVPELKYINPAKLFEGFQ